MKRGDIVRCTYPGSYPLTHGKTYEVLDRESGWITVRGDAGFVASYAYVRFEIARHNAPTTGRNVA
jgi:hypothetical protein